MIRDKKKRSITDRKKYVENLIASKGSTANINNENDTITNTFNLKTKAKIYNKDYLKTKANKNIFTLKNVF